MTLQKLDVSRHAGFSLIELLIALAIGLLLLAGLTLVFVNSSEANRELQKTAQQIENGRYGLDIVTQDLHHAGYYGHMYGLPAAPGALPDPCNIDTSNLAVLNTALAIPVQGYRAADLATHADVTATTCDDKGLLTTANLKPGSDVLVVRRASTQALTGGSTSNLLYLQATNLTSTPLVGTGAALTGTLTKKDGSPAPIRKYMVHVYFVAPCSVGSGTNGVCTGSDDTIPTLKRLEMDVVGGALAMKIVPLVEGIEYLKVEYGIDDIPAAVSPVTGLNGDATVDTYTASPAGVADWTSVIATKVYLLARNTEATGYYTDVKSYVLGSVTAPAANDRFKRHVFTASVRLVNPAGRKEIP